MKRSCQAVAHREVIPRSAVRTYCTPSAAVTQDGRSRRTDQWFLLLVSCRRALITSNSYCIQPDALCVHPQSPRHPCMCFLLPAPSTPQPPYRIGVEIQRRSLPNGIRCRSMLASDVIGAVSNTMYHWMCTKYCPGGYHSGAEP